MKSRDFVACLACETLPPLFRLGAVRPLAVGWLKFFSHTIDRAIESQVGKCFLYFVFAVTRKLVCVSLERKTNGHTGGKIK